MNDDELRMSEETDIEPYEDAPDFKESPTRQTDAPGGQDDGEL